MKITLSNKLTAGLLLAGAWYSTGGTCAKPSCNLRISAGTINSLLLRDRSAVLNNLSPDASFKRSHFGYQAGLGIDLANLTLDARYEGGFEKIVPELGGRPGSFTFSVGFKLL